MSNVIAFPRRRPLADHEMPAHWGYMERTYYEMRIEDGISHEAAFEEMEKMAATNARIRAMKQEPGESEIDFLARRARAELAALSPV